MEKYSLPLKKDMDGAGSAHRKLVCVKQVMQEAPEDWDPSLPLPGDIIEGFAKDDADDMFVPVKAKSDLSSQLGKLNNQQVEVIWVKVRRGDRAMKLQARIVQEKFSMALHKRYTIRAVGDDRHVAVLGDLTLDQCTELYERSQSVVNLDCWEFNKRGVKYDWKMKVRTYLPDQRSPVVSSILFIRLQSEYCIEATTARCMAWFSAAISSGIPLVFVNIQTEQKDKTGREISWGRQQNATFAQKVHGIRLWFLPGIEEVPLELIPRPGEARFGMDIKRTEEGFIYVYAVTRGLAADRSGLRHLHEEAIANGYLLVISRLEGKSLMPTGASSDGLVLCCDHNEIRDTLSSAMLEMDRIQLHHLIFHCTMRAEDLYAGEEVLTGALCLEVEEEVEEEFGQKVPPRTPKKKSLKP
ncbi:uncharacterized protein LOC121242239 [Juglans microcarpa x Juglans regia]|uniref:uncharacterized protein LOC121242239 n=1 Tax=Juglans microcarpa x Juglans regia TaxID=2249226 RepID=UPI001B7EF1B0|nr:uncharacterized protein LOC121242239 [Juglans microcarpa x Juglans regia]